MSHIQHAQQIMASARDMNGKEREYFTGMHSNMNEVIELNEKLKKQDEVIEVLQRALRPFTLFKIYDDYNFHTDQHKNYYTNPVSFQLVEFENHAREARTALEKVEEIRSGK